MLRMTDARVCLPSLTLWLYRGSSCFQFAWLLLHASCFKSLLRWPCLCMYALAHARSVVLFICQDVALASVSMRPIPFLPVLEKLCLSDAKYGTVRRFYIETPDDNAIPISVQESMVSKSPPEKVFRLKGADHSPFFSKPQALHKLLVEISKIP